jgi:hypothetical protein
MNNYYKITEDLRDALLQDEIINNVSQGDIFNIDINKPTIFPLAHIVVNSAQQSESGNTNIFNVSVLFMDVCDISKVEPYDLFFNNDNEADIFNSQFELANRFLTSLRRGNLYDMNYRLNGAANFEAFSDRFENKIVGWTLTFGIEAYNDMTIC